MITDRDGETGASFEASIAVATEADRPSDVPGASGRTGPDRATRERLVRENLGWLRGWLRGSGGRHLSGCVPEGPGEASRPARPGAVPRLAAEDRRERAPRPLPGRGPAARPRPVRRGAGGPRRERARAGARSAGRAGGEGA